MSVPTIPPRPSRSQGAATLPTSAMDIPRVPARPKRSVERSISPNRDSFARSPLNDPSFLKHGGRFSHRESSKKPPSDAPRRPSVDLPSIGQEGQEYANLEELQKGESPPPQTKNVAGDLPLHAPKASLPPSSAKQRIATVTRTDSSQAAAAGIGRATSEISEDKGGSATSSAAPSRPGSLYKERNYEERPSRPDSLYKEKSHDEHEELGIPEIGIQVPMYPNAGDVQAPTPSPYAQSHSPGIGFFNNGSQGSLPTGRHHSRTKSGREIFHGPPGSYGLHGHGVKARDPFEKAWYDKHPDALAREAQGEYGPAIQDNRKEWALSSEELNKLVHGESIASGMGLSPHVAGTPAEEIGYLASEEYASRIASPKPSNLNKPRTRSSQTHAESPLRKMAFPSSEIDNAIRQAKSGQHDAALESEADEDVIHVDPLERKQSRIYGGATDDHKTDLRSRGVNTDDDGGWVTEERYEAPILAADEVAKHPEREYLQPAVDLNEIERDQDSPNNLPSSRRPSRPSSRTSSLHGAPPGIQRFWTPEDRDSPALGLDEVKEYEPLFPEDEEKAAKSKSANTTDPVGKLKRPDLARHHFPSQDVWEDTPDSLKYTTTVDSPQLPEHGDKAAEHEPIPFESPEDEAARKQQLLRKDKQNLAPDHTKNLAKSHIRSGIQEEMNSARPGMKQRFPSQDIWEDAPDHVHLVTTVESPAPQEETKEKPQVPARPTVPARPQRPGQEVSPVDRKAPTIPDRPKPQVPVRPTRARASDEKVEQIKSLDGSGDASLPKAKPAVPTRPGGGKLAALQANFMSDLNKRLQLGPQAPPKPQEPEPEAEEEKEKAPLADARKGRARGPARRKPTSSASPAPKPEPQAQSFSIISLGTVWQSNGDGIEVSEGVGSGVAHSSTEKASTALETDAPLSKTTSLDTLEKTEGIPLETTKSKDSKDESTQTGQLDIAIGTGDEKQTMTAYLGGDAQSKGDVLVKDEKEKEKVSEASETAEAS